VMVTELISAGCQILRESDSMGYQITQDMILKRSAVTRDLAKWDPAGPLWVLRSCGALQNALIQGMLRTCTPLYFYRAFNKDVHKLTAN
jgi:hypothetical protein